MQVLVDIFWKNYIKEQERYNDGDNKIQLDGDDCLIISEVFAECILKPGVIF